MLAVILSFLLKLAGSSVVGQVLGHLERKADSETERQRIKSLENQNNANNAAAVIQTGMGFPLFWVAWGIAALPMAAWFGWGMLDTLSNGYLPDVASIPAGLKEYSDIVWSNIFYTGAAGAVAQTLGSAIQGRKK